MRFEPGQLVFGLVAPEILIDCANKLRWHAQHDESDVTLGYTDFCIALGAPEDESLPVLEKLIEMGAIIPNQNKAMPGTYFVGKEMASISLAKVSTGLPRAKADNLLKKIIARAEEINANQDKYGRKVKRLAVFGSYLTDKPVLGDLDIAVDLIETDKVDYNDSNWMAVSLSLTHKARSYLRLRKPEYVSVHDFDELARLKTDFKIVFEVE